MPLSHDLIVNIVGFVFQEKSYPDKIAVQREMLLFVDVCITHIAELSPFSGNKETIHRHYLIIHTEQ